MLRLKTPRPYLVIAALALFAMTTVFGLGKLARHASLGNQSASAATSPDINSDGTVNVFDLSILLAAWGTSATTSDLNSDGTVNVFDLSILLSKWGPVASPTPTPTPTPSGTPTGNITQGSQLTVAETGPWALQNVAKGQEKLLTIAAPSRGYWRMDTPNEFMPSGTYVYNNDPNNHGGILASDTMIDGYLLPAGTKVVQFEDLSASAFYAQGISGTWLFRGNRVRDSGIGGESYFNDYQATYTLNIHYGDMGGLGSLDSQDGGAFLKFIGGQNHRVLRTYFSYLGTVIQPNVPGVEITENYIDKLIYYYGEAGPCGNGGSCTYHLNGISTEGMSNVTPTNFKILRNHITMPSPDEAGHITNQTDCIALFQSNGGSYNGVLIQGNYLGGAGYALYAGASPNPTTANAPKNIVIKDNEFTTKWWTNVASYGPVAAEPVWGTNGNVASNNIWADDYGSGGDGNTALSARQYPSGNGPRKGQVIFGN